MSLRKFSKLSVSSLKNISKWIVLITSVYTLFLGIYPHLSNFPIVLGVILLILGVLEIYKSGWRSILKPGILASSLGLIILYLFVIYTVVNSAIFQSIIAVISLLIIGFLLSLSSFTLELF